MVFFFVLLLIKFTASETQEVTEYSLTYNGRNYVLADTPGFGDTYRSDLEILQIISDWASRTSFHSIIYLHPINDVRMKGSARKSLTIVQRIYGEEDSTKVLLVSTFWDDVPLSLGLEREAELISNDEFWGAMIRSGSEVKRLDYRNPDSIFDILEEVSSNILYNPGIRVPGESIGNPNIQNLSINSLDTISEREFEQIERQMRHYLRQLEEQTEARAREREAVLQQRFEEGMRLGQMEAEAQRLREVEAEERRSRENIALEQRLQERMLENQKEAERLAAEQNAELERRSKELSSVRGEVFRKYVCVSRRFSRDFPCDSCHKPIKRYSHHYREFSLARNLLIRPQIDTDCCHCNEDLYVHCHRCGNQCPKQEHPTMPQRSVPLQGPFSMLIQKYPLIKSK